MGRFVLSVTVSTALFGAAFALAQRPERLVSPDGEIVALVFPVGKKPGFEQYESRVELHCKTGKLFAERDYSSEDSEHGYGVA
jgi:hypothetical protein